MTNKMAEPLIGSIVLTGFMGTGKSTVGCLLAQQLDYPFVDMDSLLEERQKQTIPSIFKTKGEPFFRRLESDLCRELSYCQRYVIATGGGALVNEENLTLFTRSNLVICLDCAPEVLWQRLASAQDRPMLDSVDNIDRKTRLLTLLANRTPAYARIKHHVDTTDRPVQDIVADVRALWEQYKGTVTS